MTDWNDKNTEPIVLLKIYGKDKIYRYASGMLKTDDGMYDDRLNIQSATITRQFNILGYEFQSNRCQIELNNADNELTTDLTSFSTYGSIVEVFAAQKGQSYDDKVLLFTGRIQERSLDNESITLSLYDVRPNLPNIPVNPLTRGDFTDLPDDNNGRQGHLVIGQIADDADNARRLKLIKLSSTDYLVGVGKVISVQNVYVNGTLKTKDTHYTVSHSEYKSKVGFHVLVKFTSGNEPADGDLVTANVQGMGSDYIRLQSNVQEVEGSEYVVDEYAIDCSGTGECVYGSSDGSVFPTSWGDFACEVEFTANSLQDDDTLFCKTTDYVGGQKRFKLCLRADGKIRFYCAKAGGASYHYVDSVSTISTGRKVKVKFGRTSSDSMWLRVSVNGGAYDSGSRATHASDFFSTFGYQNVVVMAEPDNSGSFENYSNGKMNRVAVSGDGSQDDTNDLDTISHEYIFAQNLNDSVGSAHLTSHNISGDDYVEYSGHWTTAINKTFYPRIIFENTGAGSLADYSTSGAVTYCLRFRAPDPIQYGYRDELSGKTLFVFFRDSNLSVSFNSGTNIFGISARNGENTEFVTLVSKVIDADPFDSGGEWRELSITINFSTGNVYVWQDNVEILTNTFSVREFGTTSSDFLMSATTSYLALYPNDTYPHIEDLEIDYFACATVNVSSRRFKKPTDVEFATKGFFFDFNKDNSTTHSIPSAGDFTGTASLVLDNVDGYSGTLVEGSSGTHQFLTELNKPAEDIRDVLHYIGEPVDVDSVQTTKSNHAGLIEIIELDNGGQDQKSLNDVGQWGGIIQGNSRDVLRSLSFNSDTQIFKRTDEKWCLKYLNFESTASSIHNYNFEKDIEDRSFSLDLQYDLKNNRNVEWMRNYSGDNESSYLSNAKAQIESSMQNLEQWYYDDTFKLDFIRGEQMAKAISLAFLRKQASEIPSISFSTSLKTMSLLANSANELGEIITVSHPQCINAGWDDQQPCILESVTYNLHNGRCNISAIPLNTIENTGTFMPGDENTETGDTSGGDVISDPVYTYHYENDEASFKCIVELGDTPGTYYQYAEHGTWTGGYLARGQMKFQIPAFTGDCVSTTLQFTVSSTSGATQQIGIFHRSGEVTYPAMDSGVGYKISQVSGGTGSKSVLLPSSFYDTIENSKGGYITLGFQNTSTTEFSIWKVTWAKLTFKVRTSSQ